MRTSLPTRLLILGSLLTVPALRACSDASSVKTIQIDATGAIFGTAFFDDNGNAVLDTQDPPLKGVPVLLKVAGGADVVNQVETDSTGFFLFTDVPVGSYRLELDPGALGDSLQALAGGVDVDIASGDTTRVNFPVSYPALTLEEVRASAPGTQVITSGIALNSRQSFGDGVVHLQADTAYLRTLNVARTNIAIGDSVRMIGRVKIDQGEPVLDEVTPFVLVPAAKIPVPVDVGTAKAAGADGGKLDAALVRIRTAEITDTSTALDGSFHFHVDDGSGPVEVVLRSFLQVNTSTIRPDTVVRVRELTGLLTPSQDGSGKISWRILPRGGGDVTLEVKNADLSVAVASDTLLASQGDTLTFTVVVTNLGPLGASGVQVIDSVPQGLTYLSSSATRGTYDSGSSTWSLDSVKVGAVDTLRLRATVTTALTGQTVERATFAKLVREVDPNPNNNTAAVGVNLAVKNADLSVSVASDTLVASQGDTLTFTVVVTNLGPRDASGVQVIDSVPQGLTYLSSSATRGTYDAGSSTWSLDSVRVGPVDTLRLRATVTTAATGQTVERARIGNLVNEVDPNLNNNSAAVVVNLVAPAPGPTPSPSSPYGSPYRQASSQDLACQRSALPPTVLTVDLSNAPSTLERICRHPRS